MLKTLKQEVTEMGLKEKSRKSKLGGKPASVHASGGLFRPRTKPGLAAALALVWVALALSITVSYAEAADPGHAASSISAGTFESGDYAFPNNLSITNNLTVSGSVGIGMPPSSYLLQVAKTDNSTNISGVLYVNGTSGRVGIMYATLTASSALYVNGSTYTSGTLSSGSDIYTTGTGDDLWLGNSTQANSKLQLFANGGINALFWNFTVNETTGNIGIGKIMPNYKLEVETTENALNVSNTLFVNGTSGRVGIGTASPAQKLQVEGWATIRLNTTASGGLAYDISAYRYGVSNAGFEIRDITASVTRIAIDENGKVGIGTAAPSKWLEVSNSTQGITFDPNVTSPTINTTATKDLIITAGSGNVIIQLG